MDMSDKDKFELQKRDDNPINYHSSGAISSDWQFNGGNLPSSSLGLVPTDRRMTVCRGDDASGDLVGASSCTSTSLVDPFGPVLWDQPNNTQSVGYCDINGQSNASTSNTLALGKGSCAPLRVGIDRTPDVGWNPPSIMLKGGIFLPNMPGMIPQSVSQFPSDSGFIERAARFSCFNGGNLGDMVNPFGISESMGLYSSGGGMIQGPKDAFLGSGLNLLSGGQAQKNVVSVAETSKLASLSVDHAATEGSPLKNGRKTESLVRSHDEAKQAVAGSFNESDEAEFSGDGGDGGGEDEPSVLEGNGGEFSSKGLGSKKRKRIGQDTEQDQAKGAQQSGQVAKDNPETQQKGDQNPATTSNKTTGKQGKQSSQASDLPKGEYIHVRARRGQATNSHSLAERVRREKISERMKFLQDLVPGCTKVTGKAVMLDEIINYVQSLQRQVEFLSMKLATVNPRLDFNLERLLAKDILQSPAVPTSTLALPPEMHMAFPSLHLPQPGLLQAPFPSMEAHSEVLWRTLSSHLMPMAGAFKEPTQQPSNAWDDELHNVVQMSYGTNTPPDSQDMTGSLPHGHTKVEH